MRWYVRQGWSHQSAHAAMLRLALNPTETLADQTTNPILRDCSMSCITSQMLDYRRHHTHDNDRSAAAVCMLVPKHHR